MSCKVVSIGLTGGTMMASAVEEAVHGELLACYQLAPPKAVSAEADAVAQLIRRELGVADPQRHVVHVTDWSGWIRYTDQRSLWGDSGADLPSRETALERAEAWLRRYMQSLSPGNPRLPEALRRFRLTPTQVKPLEFSAIAHPAGRGFDHWLYRAEPQMRLGNGLALAPVLGAAVEIRVGQGGRIIGFNARWRALTGQVVSAARSAPRPRPLQSGHSHDSPVARPRTAEAHGSPPQPHPHDHAHGDHDHEEGHDHPAAAQTPQAAGTPEAAPALVYLLDGDACPQNFLSPYYLARSGHAMSVASACRMSLTIDLLGRNTRDGTELMAIVAGGSGSYRVSWGYAPVEDPFELTTLGEGSNIPGEDSIGAGTITIPVGAHLVLVEARDRETGAVRYEQRYVYSSPVFDDGEPALPPEAPLIA